MKQVSATDLDTTPSGFSTIPWSLALGERLARNRAPFMPRAVRMRSVRDALRASAIMLALWRGTPDAPQATLRGGATGLHLAVQHQVSSLLSASIIMLHTAD